MWKEFLKWRSRIKLISSLWNYSKGQKVIVITFDSVCKNSQIAVTLGNVCKFSFITSLLNSNYFHYRSKSFTKIRNSFKTFALRVFIFRRSNLFTICYVIVESNKTIYSNSQAIYLILCRFLSTEYFEFRSNVALKSF